MSEEKKVKGVVDLVFLLDSTGSMQECIDGLKANIKLFFQRLTTKDEHNQVPVREWRAKVVGFRDYDDNPLDWLVDNPFTSHVEDLYAQLDGLVATGGGDIPESMLDALYAVVEQEETPAGALPEPHCWRFRRDAARAVIAFTDAPFKPVIHAPFGRGGTVDDVINRIMEKRVLLTVVTPYRYLDEHDRVREFDEMHVLAEADKAEYLPLKDVHGETLSLASFARDQEVITRLLTKLAKTLSKSVETQVL
ncbi:MAG: hypothetical protein ACI4SG_02235 [Oligosphaeraceae bacterium]